MDDVQIDRLSLAVPDLTEAEAARLARLVASGLAAANLPGTGLPIPLLRVDLTSSGSDVDALAKLVVERVLGSLARIV